MAKVSGYIDIVNVLEAMDEEKIIEEVWNHAKQKAIVAGADPATVKIIFLENILLQYVQMRVSRIVVMLMT